jgi:putative membrane protein
LAAHGVLKIGFLFEKLLLKNFPRFTIPHLNEFAIRAFYEIIEWGSTKIGKEGKDTKYFLGMQGDIWDAKWELVTFFYKNPL